jgi:hypothetical protein
MQINYLYEEDGEVWKTVENVIRLLIEQGFQESDIRENDLVLKGIMLGVIRGFMVRDFERSKVQ